MVSRIYWGNAGIWCRELYYKVTVFSTYSHVIIQHVVKEFLVMPKLYVVITLIEEAELAVKRVPRPSGRGSGLNASYESAHPALSQVFRCHA